jgi:hypothetical protein
MRQLVLRMIVDAVAPPSLRAAETVILTIPNDPRAIPPVVSADIEDVSDPRLRNLLLKLLKADANVIRNRVVHKDAYRPREAESRRVHREAQEILFGLTTRLGIGARSEWYVNQPPISKNIR